MIENTSSRASGTVQTSSVRPPNGALTRESLPPADTTRWVASRKAQVVRAVQSGVLSIEEVMHRYRLSLEEYVAWERAMDRAGVAGLSIAFSRRDRAERRREPASAANRLAQFFPV